MSRHQIIYTSCMRGINGVNDGQQVFSYDADFKDSQTDEIKRLFTYQVPALDTGLVMTEEIAAAMPQSFMYRKLTNGACAFTLNTYLGRDYMGSSGRFGNHLSHAVICDEDEINCYPCEFYRSPMLRDRMKYEEVNNPGKPDYLPTPDLTRGSRVNIDSVIEFLGQGNRLQVFKNMIHAMLLYSSERKRVVICDEPQNIIMWIAGLEYVLPLNIALNINFSTYDYDPALSVSQICGVVANGTKYNADSARQHFVFDLLSYDTLDFGIINNFYEFIDIAMSFSYDSLQAFHQFLNNYRYTNADENLYSAYTLYEMKLDGIENMDQAMFESAIAFSDNYGTNKDKYALLQQLLSERAAILKFDDSFSISILKYIASNYPMLDRRSQEEFKSVVIDRILAAFLNSQNRENDFTAFYNTLERLCQSVSFSIATELMKEDNRRKLLTVMNYDVAAWKLAFIIRMICDYIKEKRVPADELNPEFPLGRLYAGIIQSVYKTNTQNGFYLVTKIMDNFSNNWDYLVNMALNMEGILLDTSAGERAVKSMWDYFYQLCVKYQFENRRYIFKTLQTYERFDQMFELFCAWLNGYAGLREGRTLFADHLKSFLLVDRKYSKAYLVDILDAYYKYISKSQDGNRDEAVRELLDIILKNKLEVPFADDLINDFVQQVPMEPPSKANGDIIIDIFDYTYKFRKQRVTGRFQMIIVGMFIQGMRNPRDLASTFDKLERVGEQRVDLSLLSRRETESYLNWIVPHMAMACQTYEELEQIHDFFFIPANLTEIYFSAYAREYVKQNKSDKDYKSLCQFLRFLFECGSQVDRDACAKILGKFNRQKLETLDAEFRLTYSSRKKYIVYWEEMREVAASTNPLLNNISNLFKRKKD